MQTLERQKRPSPQLRGEMVKIVVSEMMICKNPTKRNSTEIAERMVNRYPKSLKDVIDGDVIGLGYHSLVKQLQARIENVRRPDTPKITKRKAESDNDTDEIPAEQKASVQDTYGCVNWEQKFFPLREPVESQLQKKENVKMFKDKTSLESLLKLKTENGQSSGCTEMVLLLLAYFGEKEENMFHYVEKTTLAEEVEMEDVPATPCLIVCGTYQVYSVVERLTQMPFVIYICSCCLFSGSSCFTADCFMLSIDKKIVNDHITAFSCATCLMFGSYYCLNIHYPVGLRSTLEFLQR